MAKCWLCSDKKGKRYCSPLDRVICPVCCGTSRLTKIDCNADCHYLGGVAYQKKRAGQKEFAELMNQVPHGQYDDIFQEPSVAIMAYQIETLIRDIYMNASIRITDTIVYEAYKTIYRIYFQREQAGETQPDELTEKLMALYARNIKIWKVHMNEGKIGQVFLRLMVSVKNMTGGRMGEFGYLNYLKNNLGKRNKDEGVVVEDKFGYKTKFSEDT